MSSTLHVFEQLGEIAVTWSWQVALLIAFLWVAVRFDRRHRPQFRYWLWTFALIVSLSLPWLPRQIGSYSWTIRAKEVWTDPQALSVTAAAHAENTAIGSTKSAATVSVSAISTVDASDTDRSSFSIYMAVGLFWLAGVVIAAARRIREHSRMRRIVRESALAPTFSDVSQLPVRLTPEVPGPVLYGLLRPVILLPASIEEWSSAEDCHAILRHESVHFKKRHHWAAALEGLAGTVFFFHPLFRWLCRQLDAERELICDAAVLKLGTDPDRYAETLLRVAEQAVAGSRGVHFSEKAQLSRRLEFVFRPILKARASQTLIPLLILTPVLSLGFSQAQIERLGSLESSIWTRFLPALPVQDLTRSVQSLRSSPMQPTPTPASPQQGEVRLTFNPVEREVVLALQEPSPTQQDPAQPNPEILRGIRMAVTNLRGSGGANEVRLTAQLPYELIHFEERTSLAGTRFRRASAFVEFTVRSLNGRTTERLGDPIEIEVLSSQFRAEGIAVFQKAFTLAPGVYSIRALATNGPDGALVGVSEYRVEIPAIPAERLAVSSLVLADLIERLPPRVTNAQFALGNFKVRPNVGGVIRRGQNVRLFQQIYGVPSGGVSVETLFTRNGEEFRRTVEQMEGAPDLVINQMHPYTDFPTGDYQVQLTITEVATGQRVASKAAFTVE